MHVLHADNFICSITIDNPAVKLLHTVIFMMVPALSPS